MLEHLQKDSVKVRREKDPLKKPLSRWAKEELTKARDEPSAHHVDLDEL